METMTKRQKMAKGTKSGHLHCFTTGTASECGHHRQVLLTCCLAVSQQKLVQKNWWFHDGIPPKVDDCASGLTNHYCAPPEAPELKRTLVTLASLTLFHHNSCNTCIYNISLLSNQRSLLFTTIFQTLRAPAWEAWPLYLSKARQVVPWGKMHAFNHRKQVYNDYTCRQTLDHLEIWLASGWWIHDIMISYISMTHVSKDHYIQ